MKLKTIKLKNFRGYRDELVIDFDNFTAFVGKNDIGKSTIMEALDIFFNDGKGVVKIDKDDINKQGQEAGDNDIRVTALFEELPETVVIDTTNQTTLQAEYLLNARGQLEIVKKYQNAGGAKVFVKALHPTNPECEGLLSMTSAELKRVLDAKQIDCNDRSRNAIMRAAIWNHFGADLLLTEIEIDVTKGDTKSIWEKLSATLPTYSLFQADRKNSDGDSEVQDPLKEAVKQIMQDTTIASTLAEVAEVVKQNLKEVADRTLEKLNEMAPDVADSLKPVIPSASSLKWVDVFKSVTISGDENIPINKRGSGVKRLILLNFFRAEAERRNQNSDSASIIYAIEEPETSQHTVNQKMLIESLKQLASLPNTQVIITTHSSFVVKALEFSNLRLINSGEAGKTVSRIEPGQLPYPSLNEVNYLAFSEVSEEYHNELFGFIEETEGNLNNYKVGKTTIPYIRERTDRNGVVTINETKILTEYIRHQIHHPENRRNPHYTQEQLAESIRLMREYIEQNLR